MSLLQFYISSNHSGSLPGWQPLPFSFFFTILFRVVFWPLFLFFHLMSTRGPQLSCYSDAFCVWVLSMAIFFLHLSTNSFVLWFLTFWRHLIMKILLSHYVWKVLRFVFTSHWVSFQVSQSHNSTDRTQFLNRIVLVVMLKSNTYCLRCVVLAKAILFLEDSYVPAVSHDIGSGYEKLSSLHLSWSVSMFNS